MGILSWVGSAFSGKADPFFFQRRPAAPSTPSIRMAPMSDATDVTESPNTSEPTNTPEPNVFNPHDPDLNIIRRCRSLTVRGVQCRQAALRGQDFCIQHFDRNTPTLGRTGSIAVPLLKDHSAVQLMLTRILHGLLNRQLEPLIATKAIACCRVAALTFPRPAAVARLRPATHPETAEAVPIISTDGAGNLIGPRVLYEGTTDWGVAPTSELGCDRSFMPSHEPRSKCLDDPRYLANPNASLPDSADEPRRVWIRLKSMPSTAKPQTPSSGIAKPAKFASKPGRNASECESSTIAKPKCSKASPIPSIHLPEPHPLPAQSPVMTPPASTSRPPPSRFQLLAAGRRLQAVYLLSNLSTQLPI